MYIFDENRIKRSIFFKRFKFFRWRKVGYNFADAALRAELYSARSFIF